MRLQTKGAPDPADGHAAEPAGLSQTAGAPVRLPPRRALQSLNHNFLNLSIADLAGCSRSGLVIESLQPLLQKTGAPLVHHAHRAAHLLSHYLVGQALGG